MGSLGVVVVLVVLCLSAFVRSAVGFGDALIAMPLLVLIVGARVATPLVAMGSSTIAFTILLGAWRGVDLRATWRLVLSTLLGIPIGLIFLKGASEGLVKGVLGAVLVAYGVYNLWGFKMPALGNEKLSYLFGFVAGVLGGAYNTNGPPVLIYGMLRGWTPERFRATLQGYFLPAGLAILISHGLAGLWTPEVVRLYVLALPLILGAVLLGGWVNRRVNGDRFQRIVYALLVLMGLLLFL